MAKALDWSLAPEILSGTTAACGVYSSIVLVDPSIDLIHLAGTPIGLVDRTQLTTQQFALISLAAGFIAVPSGPMTKVRVLAARHVLQVVDVRQEEAAVVSGTAVA